MSNSCNHQRDNIGLKLTIVGWFSSMFMFDQFAYCEVSLHLVSQLTEE